MINMMKKAISLSAKWFLLRIVTDNDKNNNNNGWQTDFTQK
jgi:hypothetical protein